MTGYVTLVGGDVWRLPPLTEWMLERTATGNCDAFTVKFPYEASRAGEYRRAIRFFAKDDDGKTVFTGVVDEFAASIDKKGSMAVLSGRGMAALLCDNQVRAAEFSAAQLGDILKRYVYPWGVGKVDFSGEKFPAVRGFAVDSGSTCWQALGGFCRHSAGILPRFDAEGVLILKKSGGGKWQIGKSAAVRSAKLRLNRYGVMSRCVLVDTKGGAQSESANGPFLRLGGSASKVLLRQGIHLRANWRSAAQRIEDSMAEADMVTLELPGACAVEPGDTVTAALPNAGVNGTYTASTIRHYGSAAGRYTTLELKGTMT